MRNVSPLDIEENPWIPLQYEIEHKERKPYPHEEKKGITSPLQYKVVHWTNKIDIPAYHKFEIRRTDTGKVWKEDILYITFPYKDNELPDYSKNPVVRYEKYPNYIDVDPSLIEFRIEDKLLRHTQWVLQNLRVGDFVLCKGTRSGDWNKVEKIIEDTEVFGPKYSKPEEGKMRYSASTNGISKIQKIVRDGVEIKKDGE